MFVPIITTLLLAITATTTFGQQALPYCFINGDPHLTAFQFGVESVSTSSVWCNITNNHVLLFRTPFAAVSVINNDQAADTITDFSIVLFDSIGIPVCTVNTLDFNKLGNRNCGSNGEILVVTETSQNLNIRYSQVTLTIWVSKFSSSTGPRYSVQLWSSHQHASESTGMCRSGCTRKRFDGLSSRSNLIKANSQNDKVSQLAVPICNEYINELKRQNSSALKTPSALQDIEAQRQSCIIDLTVTGMVEFANEHISAVVHKAFSRNAVSIANITTIMKQTPTLIQNVVNVGNRTSHQIVQDSTFPCKPGVALCFTS